MKPKIIRQAKIIIIRFLYWLFFIMEFKISLFITTLLLSLLFTIFLELFLSRKLILFEKNKNINNI
jgi:hypothetical protein